LLGALSGSHSAAAQELTPRAYWPLPSGTNVMVLAYQHSSGDIVTDASLPITGVDSSIHFLQAAYQRSFGLFGRSASMQLSLPYSDAFFICAFPRECTEAFQMGHLLAFEFFGAVPWRISYDNSKVAVSKIVGKRLLFCEDSIVRGTQLKDVIQRLFDFGAREVHMRPACPPLVCTCKFLNFSRSRSELDLAGRKAIADSGGDAANHLAEYADPSTERYAVMIEKIRERLGLTSLQYQSLDDMVDAIGLPREKLCTYCWNGESLHEQGRGATSSAEQVLRGRELKAYS